MTAALLRQPYCAEGGSREAARAWVVGRRRGCEEFMGLCVGGVMWMHSVCCVCCVLMMLTRT